MKHDAQKYLHDISKAAKDIQHFIGARSFDEYSQDALVKAAVERKFEVIGEALNRIHKEFPESVQAIREYEKIIAFRNIVIHGYDVSSQPLAAALIAEAREGNSNRRLSRSRK